MVDPHREPDDMARIREIFQKQNEVNQSFNASIEQLASDVELLFRMVRGQDQKVRVLGRTSTHHGDGGIPLEWVFTPPAPYSDVEIACAPDGAEEIGMRCHAAKKLPGGMRIKFQIAFTDKEVVD